MTVVSTGGWAHGYANVHGARLHYVRAGRGPALMLLHGWPEFWWTWHRTIPALARRFTVVAPDLRGFGDSRTIGDDHRPPGAEVHAADVLGLADVLGFDRFGIVAHDVGAHVAQTVARARPERLTGLFFFNCPYPGIGRRWADAGHVKEIWYQSFHQQPWAAALVGHDRETCRIYFEGMMRHWCRDPGVVDAVIGPLVDNFMKPGAIAGGFAWYAATHAARMALVRDGAPALPPITVPSRFFWGRHDPVLPCAWMDRLGDDFRDPVTEIAEEAGHFVHLEMPDAANRRIADFFAGLSAAESGLALERTR